LIDNILINQLRRTSPVSLFTMYATMQQAADQLEAIEYENIQLRAALQYATQLNG
jgi:hypothetical protein